MLTDKEKALWQAEVKDPTGRVLLKCEDHNFYPGSQLAAEPQLGCRECAAAELFYQMATTPPHKRAEMLDMMEAAIHYMVEAEEAGQPVRIFDRPVVDYERNVN